MQQLLKYRTKLTLAGAIGLLFLATVVGYCRENAAGDEETYKHLKLFSDVLELVQENYVDEVPSKELINKAIEGMVEGLDPHSTLLSPEELQELQMDTYSEFTGVGVSITMRNKLVTVVSPIEGTPAYRAGIVAGDRIFKVDGKQTRDLRQAVKLIRGPKGTKVVLTILRKGEKKPLTFEIVRGVIPVESVRSFVLEPGYGYIWITNFRDHTGDELLEGLEKIETEGGALKGLVLDLRDNPGGLLNQAIEVSDLFLEEGTILSIKGRDAVNAKVFKAHPDNPVRDYPIVILVNGGSASASEIVAGALQDQHRALILGTPSFGKGSVQNVERLRDGYGLKLTIARYYTPSGRSIQAKGIEPDILVEKRFLPVAEKEADSLMLKEKDLQNHLEAEAGEEDSIEPTEELPLLEDLEEDADESSEDTDGKKPMDAVQFRQGPLTAEKLKADNQVARALEILIGYNLFEQMGQ